MELTLAPAESLVMQCLWESGADLTVYEITKRLHEVYGKDYANNAVATFMTVLMKKGFVSRYKYSIILTSITRRLRWMNSATRR